MDSEMDSAKLLEEIERILQGEDLISQIFNIKPIEQQQNSDNTNTTSTITTPNSDDRAFVVSSNPSTKESSFHDAQKPSPLGTQAESLTISQLAKEFVVDQHGNFHLKPPTNNNIAMKVSTGTMPQTPIKLQTSATSPMTPIGRKSIGTMTKTPSPKKTIGTHPKTPPTTKTIGTMHSSPIVDIQTISSGSSHETIDLISSDSSIDSPDSS